MTHDMDKVMPAEVYNTFVNLAKDLEPFVDMSNMRVSFDKDNNALLEAPDFTEKIDNTLSTWRAMRAHLHQLIAKHRSISSPGDDG
jgi:hypothetical protein